MDASGSAHEGWMTFVPLMVLLFIVMYVMGGPAQFANVVVTWTTDAANYVLGWIKYL
jgi:hypothetical protein